ncbi:MAG: hypothetical protein V3U72_00590 [Candidatus Aenigmarchaeota archaeon]
MRLAFFVVFCVIFLSVTVHAQEYCKDGEKRVCGTDMGVCESGRSVCEGGKWVGCEGRKGPVSGIDICGNGMDDDCNGEIDEGCLPWASFILVGLVIFFIGIGLYYTQKGEGGRIITEGLGKD